MEKNIYTIGHSNHSIDEFLNLLEEHEINAIVDVRSSPYSKFNPQFNRETLKDELKKHDILYVYLGKELGPRSDDSSCYKNGKAVYNLISDTDLFREGLGRLNKGIVKYKIALMCSEKDPITCHRMILICRIFREDDIKIEHILENGELETNQQAEKRLMKALKIPELSLFDSPDELINQAYDKQSEKIAYEKKNNE
ncbi:DUF488 domain-containing protein [Desulfobacterales bacterium HSG17]|nr:DUF488 domain-containing protein [Desulfobacterales bacterium HSG17]